MAPPRRRLPSVAQSKRLRHAPEIAGKVAAILAGIGGIRAGKMFGLPAHYVGRRLFVCVYEQGVALKLPLGRVEELIDSGDCQPFRPLNKGVMRNWVWRPLAESFDPQAERPLLLEAAAHVQSLPGAEPPQKSKARSRRRQPSRRV
jgi:hypothetical protein